MPTIRVNFRGPMLFITDTKAQSDRVHKLIIPDAAPEKEPEANSQRIREVSRKKKASHFDASVARPHHAALLFIGEDEVPAYYPLHGRKVHISAEGKSGAPNMSVKFPFLAPIHRMAAPGNSGVAPLVPLKPLPDHPTIVTFDGGTLGCDATVAEVELPCRGDSPLPEPLGVLPYWDGQTSTGTLRITGGGEPDIQFALTDKVVAWIYNWDDAFPTVKELERPFESAGPMEDDDFKWVYDLFEPERGTWEKWLTNADGKRVKLPAPRSISEKTSDTGAAGQGRLLDPPTSTCDSARWSGEGF